LPFSDVSTIETMFQDTLSETMPALKPSVHEQEDGVILAVCATGTSSRDSLVSWIKFLEKSNPRLGKDLSVIFTLKSPIGPTDDLELLTDNSVHSQNELQENVVQGIGLDPGNPELKQVGVWKMSESEFPNWPHHHNPETLLFKERLKQRVGEKKLRQSIGVEDAKRIQSESIDDDTKNESSSSMNKDK